jgi:hypothetical protein
MPRVIYGYARSARRLQHSLLLPEVQAVHAVAPTPKISREPALRIYFCRGGLARPLFEFAYVGTQFIAPLLRFDFLERWGCGINVGSDLAMDCWAFSSTLGMELRLSLFLTSLL